MRRLDIMEEHKPSNVYMVIDLDIGLIVFRLQCAARDLRLSLSKSSIRASSTADTCRPKRNSEAALIYDIREVSGERERRQAGDL